MDVNTHKAMTETDWQKYMAQQFMVAIRNAFPGVRDCPQLHLVCRRGNDHRNAVPRINMWRWNNRPADYINLERGWREMPG